MDDQHFIKEALALAAQGLGQVSPNPMVGAVIVKDGEIVGRGFHRFLDRRHAEVVAIEEAGARARGATMYTNLEPCSHFGRTPPCTEAIINAGIVRVVSAMRDPNPKVLGRGFEQLRGAGIEVSVGLGEKESLKLNEVFVTYFAKSRPFVHLKTAMSLDGRIATRTGDTQWITGEPARQAVQELRHRYDAILVGIVTALADNPALTYRGNLTRHKPLIRIILDSKLRLPLHSRLAQTTAEAPVWVFTAADQPEIPLDERKSEKREQLEKLGVRVIDVPTMPNPESGEPRIDLRAVLTELAADKVTSVMVEGGAEVAGSFLTAKLIDKATFFIAPVLIGGRAAISALGGDGFATLNDAPRLLNVEVKHVGRDVMITGYPPA
ncbi:MAG: bifunctional diaminohydroxyphosphoribosylaminopyrimidine deaminase/5-amino-6-(5-phosphoribosylamino)uracil reductase RibD [Blastocatellia bacterium]|nr:bifunctional diaminohydroxyphosphoribosylaminopyrimidine deaminase/5-amino-6-(5-phosphoribosylamino)uracil reductase RibD [Blastocatellia bacterium]